ncbi:hypothetical protein [Photobacterium leiognathi]|uniref:hypothetical protein n=1 Tax=Photobacterium leiognathi TaxID=553611 RepID=UPI0029820B65|nr:hypothetical protein [Photobacterium leiognathi]
MKYFSILLFFSLFNSPAYSETDIHLSWSGVIPKLSSNMELPIELTINNIDIEFKNNPWLKENRELSIKYSNVFGDVKIIELNCI